MQPVIEVEEFRYRVRPMGRGEEGFIFGPWIRSYLSSSSSRRLDSDDYYKGQLSCIEGILRRGGVVRVAEHETYGTLLGFGVAEVHEERPCLHYIYVKGDYRRRGIARDIEAALLKHVRTERGITVRVSHKREGWLADLCSRRGYRFNPFCLLPPKET